jgi:hypothetical protein
MGVTSPEHISRYYITSMNAVDVLRIVYERPEGSFLTSSRSYKFPRVHAEDNKSSTLKTHPMLKRATAELDELLASLSSRKNIAAEILAEIALLEEDIAMRSEHLKALAKRIPTAD